MTLLQPSVVQIATESLAMGFGNQPSPSQGVGADPVTDLAIIRITANGLTPAKLGDASALQVGEDVIAIGHALGLDGGPTVSKGVVSTLGRSLDTGTQNTIVDLIQTDAAINPGNSGGPLVNTRAEVVGINIDDAKVVAAHLLERRYVERGFLGITPVNVTPGMALQFSLPVNRGIILARVIAGPVADAAGLQAEDMIVELAGQPIENVGELSKFLIAHMPGETVEVVYFTGDTRLTTNASLGERP